MQNAASISLSRVSVAPLSALDKSEREPRAFVLPLPIRPTAAPRSAALLRPKEGGGAWSALSLFSGCGGMDLGFAMNGTEAHVALDFAPAAVAAYNLNNRPAARLSDLSQGLPALPTADVLLAGAPCQGFSTNGRRDVNDRRNELLCAIDAACRTVRPRVVVAENVPAALSGDHSSHWRRLEAALVALGYNVRSIVLNAAQHGVAQSRRRLFLIAWLGSDCIRLDVPKAGQPVLSDALASIVTCSDHAPRNLPSDGEAIRIARRILPGQKLSNVRLGDRNVPTWDIPEVFGVTSSAERAVLVAVTRLRRRDRRRSFGDGDPVAAAAISHEVGFDASVLVDSLVNRRHLRHKDGGIEHRLTYNGKYRRLEWSSISPTVDTHFADPRLFLHPTEHRGMSLREAMRIQGFPDWFRVHGSQTNQFRLIGNAVPPPLAGDVATFVREALLKA